jgi:hypothetical protein
MSRIADYVKTLGPAERKRFAGEIEECTGREAAIAEHARQARASVQKYESGMRELRDRILELKRLSSHLRDNITLLYLAAAPPQGRVS